jgi:hypothetical protein
MLKMIIDYSQRCRVEKTNIHIDERLTSMDNARFNGVFDQRPYDPNRLLPDDTNILVLDEDSDLNRKSTDRFSATTNDMQQYHAFTNRIQPSSISLVHNDDPTSIITDRTANDASTSILDAETIAKHMSKIGKTANATSIAYLTLTLPVNHSIHFIPLLLLSFDIHRATVYVI